jgi:hypothetical protein
VAEIEGIGIAEGAVFDKIELQAGGQVLLSKKLGGKQELSIEQIQAHVCQLCGCCESACSGPWEEDGLRKAMLSLDDVRLINAWVLCLEKVEWV